MKTFNDFLLVVVVVVVLLSTWLLTFPISGFDRKNGANHKNILYYTLVGWYLLKR